jgi:N-acyl homoserine lactone hydrolase
MSSQTLAATGTVSRMWALDAPILKLPEALLVIGGGEGALDCPFPSFLIEHPDGRVLIDTGMCAEAATDPVGAYGDVGAHLLPDGFDRDLAVDRQLEKLGYQPSDIDIVVMTHLHLDHTGLMPLFKHAQFVGGLGEMRFALWPDPSQQNGFFRNDDFAFLRDTPEQWIEVGPEDYDLFGDGSVVLYHLPGHTPGQLAVLVRTPEQNILLASDVVHIRAGLSGLPFPNDWNAEQTARSIARLKAIAKATKARMWIGHDPEDWAIMKHAPDVYDGAS